MPLYTYKLAVQYLGTNFYGWQKQSSGLHRTVQGVIEDALAVLLKHEVRVYGASRTDRGVHAFGQAAHLRIPMDVEPRHILRGLNGILPPDVAVTEITRKKEGFHARFDAKKKIYVYRIYNKYAPSPLYAHTACHIAHTLDWEEIRRAVMYLEGNHDFRAFCATGSAILNTRCTVMSTRVVRRQDGIYEIWIEADRFLYKMVRLIAGTLIDIGKGRIQASHIKKMIDTGVLKGRGDAAVASGLMLWKVAY